MILVFLLVFCTIAVGDIDFQDQSFQLKVERDVDGTSLDIQRRAINIPLDFQLEGLVLEINITNCDGTKYKKKHQYHPLKYRNGKGGLRQLRIHKNLVRKGTTKNQIEPDEDGLQELRPQIDFHKFLK